LGIRTHRSLDQGTTTILIPITQHGANNQTSHGKLNFLEILLHNFMIIHIPIHINNIKKKPSPMAALKETMAASKEIMAATIEASARLQRTMSAFLIQAEEDRQEFERMNNSITQSYEKIDAHFEQIMDILKEEECQGQLVANPNEYYMEDEYTYYHEQTTTTPRNEETIEENFCEPSLEDPLGEHLDQFYEQVVVENQVDERKEEQT
jgi:hypothetical protein